MLISYIFLFMMLKLISYVIFFATTVFVFERHRQLKNKQVDGEMSKCMYNFDSFVKQK